MWPEEAPFHTPVFVVTQRNVTPGSGRVAPRPLRQRRHRDRARTGPRAGGDRDVRIAGGAATIVEYVNAGMVDESSIALSPVLFGSGIPLFEGVHAGRVALEQVREEPSPRVAHLTYRVRERSR